jgi:hypothetical protein
MREEDAMYRTLHKALARIGAGCAAFLLAAGCILLPTTAALGQGPPQSCYPRDYLLSLLQEQFGEVPVGAGVTGGKLVELLTSEDGISWTIILTSPNGISCMITGGEAWRVLPRAPKGPAV